MRCSEPNPPIVVRSDDGTTIEVVAVDGSVRLTIDRTDATLDRRSADDLVHAVLEAMT